MVLKDTKPAFDVLKIYGESQRVVLYSMETTVSDKTETFRSNLTDTIRRLQDVLDNMED
jgi:hypothetical protein